ncbi:hypothetical protein T08_12582 [Trichinella sp. T8]|nr:hypothetical protein T08_12582 [Trichinella sp. T8]
MADVVLFGHTSLEIIQLVGECCSCQAAGPRLNYLLVRRHSAKLSFYDLAWQCGACSAACFDVKAYFSITSEYPSRWSVSYYTVSINEEDKCYLCKILSFMYCLFYNIPVRKCEILLKKHCLVDLETSVWEIGHIIEGTLYYDSICANSDQFFSSVLNLRQILTSNFTFEETILTRSKKKKQQQQLCY